LVVVNRRAYPFSPQEASPYPELRLESVMLASRKELDMPQGKNFLSKDRQHTEQTSYRCLDKMSRNRDNTSPSYKVEWVSQECLMCQ
jgi:hypothetical protein